MLRLHNLILATALTLWVPVKAYAQTNVWAGSLSCRECHAKFYQLWSTSFHGLAMQPYSGELAKALTAQKSEILAGKYRFMFDLQKNAVVERSPQGETSYPILS